MSLSQLDIDLDLRFLFQLKNFCNDDFQTRYPFCGHLQTVQTLTVHMPHYAVSDQGPHCLVTGIGMQNTIAAEVIHQKPLMDSSK